MNMKASRFLLSAAICVLFFAGVLRADPVYFGWETQATLKAEDFQDDPTFDQSTEFFASYTDPLSAQEVETTLTASVGADGSSVIITWNAKVMLYNKNSLKGKCYSTEILNVNSSPVQDLQLTIYTQDGKEYEKDAYLANPLIQTISTVDGINYVLTGKLFGPQKVNIYREYYTGAGATAVYGYRKCQVTGYLSAAAVDAYPTWTVDFKLPALKTGQTATGYFTLENKIGITTADESKTYDQYLALYNTDVAKAKAACMFDENGNRDPNAVNKNLIAVNSYDSNLIWDSTKEHVLVISWKTSGELNGETANWVDKLEIGKEYSNSYSPMFIALSPELRNWAKKYKLGLQSEDNTYYKVAQLMGMPPYIANNRQYKVFIELWVKPQYLVRPAPDPELTDYEAEINFNYADIGLVSINATYKSWFENKLLTSYTDADPWPFTGFGYTYYWSNTAFSTYGVSEYIITSPETVTEGKYTVNRLVPTVMYLSEDDDAYLTPGKYY